MPKGKPRLKVDTVSLYRAGVAVSTLVDKLDVAQLHIYREPKAKSRKSVGTKPRKPGTVSHFLNFKTPRGPRTPTFGPIEGIPVGTRFHNFVDMYHSGVHLSNQAGISGRASNGGATSIVMNGRCDDWDLGQCFIYCGEGGRSDHCPKDKQDKDQVFTPSGGNEALRVSHENGKAVRVCRGFKLKKSVYAPSEGYRYDGLYNITKVEVITGKFGFQTIQFHFARCEGQAPAPWEEDEEGPAEDSLSVKQEPEDHLAEEASQGSSLGAAPRSAFDEAVLRRAVKAEPPDEAEDGPVEEAEEQRPPDQPSLAPIPLPIPIKVEAAEELDASSPPHKVQKTLLTSN